MKLQLLHALLDAIAKMLRAVAAIQSDDFDTAETELLAVHRILEDSARDLRAA